MWGIHQSPVNSPTMACNAENVCIWWRHHVQLRFKIREDKINFIYRWVQSTKNICWYSYYPTRFHWSLFPRVQSTIFQHWFKLWHGAIQEPSHYLNQWWLVYWCIYASLGLNELMMIPILLNAVVPSEFPCCTVLLCTGTLGATNNTG